MQRRPKIILASAIGLVVGLFLMESAALHAGNLGWSHATNSQAELATALADNSVHMLEADVMLSDDGTVIMSHPPKRTSDITLGQFLDIVKGHNTQNGGNQKGIKLDFKDAHAVEPALEILTAHWGIIDAKWRGVEVWLNADVLQGPGGNAPLFNPDVFIDQCTKQHFAAKLSLGFTVKAARLSQSVYTQQHIQQMRELCRKHLLQNVTFAISAIHAWIDPTHVLTLLDDHPAYTLTFWGEADILVDRWMATLDTKRIYIDVIPPRFHISSAIKAVAFLSLFMNVA